MKKSAMWMIPAVLVLLLCSCCGQEEQDRAVLQSQIETAPPPAASASLPPHTVADDSSLAPKDGRRVQLNSENPNLTKAECTTLINAYRHRGGKEGQVSVHKPSNALKGSMTPFCYDNLDGTGIVFNDSMF